jgi:hypothetical protein
LRLKQDSKFEGNLAWMDYMGSVLWDIGQILKWQYRRKNLQRHIQGPGRVMFQKRKVLSVTPGQVCP